MNSLDAQKDKIEFSIPDTMRICFFTTLCGVGKKLFIKIQNLELMDTLIIFFTSREELDRGTVYVLYYLQSIKPMAEAIRHNKQIQGIRAKGGVEH